MLNVIGDCSNDDKCPPRQITAGSELQNKRNYRGLFFYAPSLLISFLIGPCVEARTLEARVESEAEAEAAFAASLKLVAIVVSKLYVFLVNVYV